MKSWAVTDRQWMAGFEFSGHEADGHNQVGYSENGTVAAALRRNGERARRDTVTAITAGLAGAARDS